MDEAGPTIGRPSHEPSASPTGRGLSDLFVGFDELDRRVRGKSVVLFGSGNACRQIAKRIGTAAKFIVDNNPALQGTEDAGLTILGPERLARCDRDSTLIVICTSAIEAIATQLREIGFTPVEQFVASPAFADLKIVEEIESLDADLIFASGTPVSDNEKIGGGLYSLSKRGDEVSYRKIYSGFCYAFTRQDGHYYTVDHNRGLIHLDDNFALVRETAMPSGARGHGIAYSEATGRFYVAATYLDRILVFDRDLKPAGAIEISDTFERLGVPGHHLNDMVVAGTSLYVSMFSQTGRWHERVFDGGIIEIDLESQAIGSAVVGDLWMPHSLIFDGDRLFYLDSLRGELRCNGEPPFGKFPGFSRGLATDGRYFFVGQSKHRHHGRIRQTSLNSSLDVSIVVFDPHSKVSKSLPLPSKLSEIHALELA